MSHSTSRDMFRSGIGAFAATLGSAIGLGNIWKFPFLTGMNGGSAFVFAYLLSVLLVGLPILVTEHVIGRRMRMNAVPAYAAAGRARIWSAIGYAGLVAAVLIMAFYTDIAGWVFAYVFKSLSAAASGRVLGPEDFQALAGGTLEPLAWQTMVLVLVVIIVGAGVSRGIERATKTLMPLLLVLLLVCDIRALTLPNSFAGVQFLFAPNPGRLSPAVLLSALGLAFFK
ncbi:MAG: sodium-dependent transporter, partial [Rectinemataceae bacterium]